MKKRFVLILFLSLLGCQNNINEIHEGEAELIIRTIGNTTVENFDKVGYTVMEMLQKNHKVKTSYGNSVRCIDGTCAESGYWWPLYVNGEKSLLGPKSYIVKDKDKIEFVLSKK